MAWTDSRVFDAYLKATIDRTETFDLDTDTITTALFNNSITPDRTVTLANSAYNVGQWGTANEVYQAGQWAQGGVNLASPTVTASSGTVKFDGTDTSSGTAATLQNVYGVHNYDNTMTTPTADAGVCFNYLGGSNGVSGGQMTIQWDATNGIFYITT